MCSIESYFKLASITSFVFHIGLILFGGVALSSRWEVRLYYAIFPFTVITMAVYTLLLPQAFESDKFDIVIFNRFLLYHLIVENVVIFLPSIYLSTRGYDVDVLTGMAVAVSLQTGFFLYFVAFRYVKKLEAEKGIYRDLDIRSYSTFQLRSHQSDSFAFL
uniref:DUF4870 domain-containing protein n=1 Tax=Steinernema glaseri TaxID=37863 RepID=A0A1I8AJU5_9BILA